MFDAIKNVIDTGRLHKESAELQALITTAREEREAIATELAQLALRRSELAGEGAALDNLRAELRQSQTDLAQTAGNAYSLRAVIEPLQTLAGQLARDCEALQQVCRDASQGSRDALEAVRGIERKLEPLMEMQELSTATEEKLASLNALAEHVNQKTRALEGNKHTVDRAVVEANRLSEMVWGMDVQIDKLSEGLKNAAHAEETVARIEKVTEETEQKIDMASKLRAEFTRDATRLERDGHALIETLRSSLETVGLEKRQLDAFDQRVRVLGTSLETAESRMRELAAKELHLSTLQRRMDGIGADFARLSAHADQLSAKQAELGALEERLDFVDDLAKQTSIRYDGLRQSRADLEGLRKDIHEIHKQHAEAVQLQERVTADRAALEAFGDRMTALRARIPSVEQGIEVLLGKLANVDAATRQAVRLDELAVDLDAQLARVTSHLDVVSGLESRLNALHLVSADIDRRMGEQIARRAELEALRASVDGLFDRASDVQYKVEAVTALQQQVIPLENGLRELTDGLRVATAGLDAIRREEEATTARRSELETLLEENRALAAETAERARQTQAMSDALERSVAAKDELLGELARVDQQQRDALGQLATAEEQIKRVEGIHRSLEQRRAQILISEKAVEDVEARLARLAQTSLEVDEALKAIAGRESVVAAVKGEVDSVHQLAAKSRTDLQFVSEHRAEVTAARERVDTLLAAAADAEDKIASIEARRTTIDAVHTKANLIANLLEDVRVTLEALGEQKAVIDHVAVRLARLDFLNQEAQNTIRALQHERELAERIEQNIMQLRSTRTNAPS